MVLDATAHQIMTPNQLKKSVKRVLPSPLFRIVQRIRTARHRPPPQIAQLRERYLNCQPISQHEMTLRPGITVRIDPQSRDPFEWFCFKSPEMVRELDCFLQNLGTYLSFADVGANHGIFSLAFCARRPDGHVLSVDPSAIALNILERNRQLNSFWQIQTCCIACGNVSGHVQMKRNWHHLEAVRDNKASDQDVVSVAMVTLDQLCVERNISPDLLKIDVEGFELRVLQGARRVLETAKLLFLEVHPQLINELRLSQIAIFDLLTSSGWAGCTLSEAPLTRKDFADRIHTFWTVWRNVNAATA
jgi:FkbM family methyltransferase